MPTSIAAGEFKAKCLALLDDVHDNHTEIVITKRGKPVARLVPVKAAKPRSAFGWMKGTVEITGDIFSTGEKWDCCEDD